MFLVLVKFSVMNGACAAKAASFGFHLLEMAGDGGLLLRFHVVSCEVSGKTFAGLGAASPRTSPYALLRPVSAGCKGTLMAV